MKAAIIGAKILTGPDVSNLSLEELIYRATSAALAETGVAIGDVDQVAIASSDGLDGRAISSMVTAASVGGYRKSIINSSSSGEHALVLGALQIMASRSRICLVANWAKPSESPLPEVDRLNMDPFFYRPLPLSRTELVGLQTEAIAAAAGAATAAKLGTQAQAEGATDAAVVLILASEDFARERKQPFTTIDGFGWACDSYWRGGEELASMPSLAKAAARAYRMAKISDPVAALDFVEAIDFTPLHLLMICRALGLCADGNMTEFAAQLADKKTKVRINPSGGLAARDYDFASGLAAVATSHHRLVEGGKKARGLAHAASANAAQANSVFILEAA
jgi:acetyl-CoA C-acetyltransferase